jgi:hypothetical protein
LCEFYNFQYLSDPEGLLGHKILEKRKWKRYKVDKEFLMLAPVNIINPIKIFLKVACEKS